MLSSGLTQGLGSRQLVVWARIRTMDPSLFRDQPPLPVLIRIVRMTFEPEAVNSFLEQFDETAPKIRAFEGCHHLELWQETDRPSVCTTYSHWENADALNRYRSSELFRSTWASVKQLFVAQPEARSYNVARPAHEIEERMSTQPRTKNE